MLKLAPYSFGIGDRFAHQAKAQLEAFVKASQVGVEVIPVWNKSNREHTTIDSEPPSVLSAAQDAVGELGWKNSFHIDADHIRLDTVDRFVAVSDFFTIDVANFIGQSTSSVELGAFLDRHPELQGALSVPRLDEPLNLSQAELEATATKYLRAVSEAGKVFRHVEKLKGGSNFITEVSMDETDAPQTAPELLIILAALADERIPVQTIAPKFTGRFNKGVDYQGDVNQFEKELRADLAVIAFAIRQYGLPANLKLSIHSGSDKFSIYGSLRRAVREFGTGLHVKTAGTTWLEELIGLAEGGGEGLALAKEIYVEALLHLDELCAPYASVIDIDPSRLPAADFVRTWSPQQYVDALRHDPGNSAFNPHIRQLLHVGYKIAAKMGERYLNLLDKYSATIARNVTTNIYDRHLKPIFIGD